MRQTIQQLKEKGCEVKVQHCRTFVPEEDFNRTTKRAIRMTRREFEEDKETKYSNYVLDNHGGVTKVTIIQPDGPILHGESVCSDSDQFNRGFGLLIAVGRALKSK